MKIHFCDIPEEGLTVNSTYQHDLVEQRDDDNLKFLEPFKLKTRIDKVQDDIVIKIDMQGRFSSDCSRCLISTEQEYKAKIDLFYEIEKKDADFIDITDDIRQEILLNLPPKILCSKDCKGICSSCGANLNREKCNCT